MRFSVVARRVDGVVVGIRLLSLWLGALRLLTLFMALVTRIGRGRDRTHMACEIVVIEVGEEDN